MKMLPPWPEPIQLINVNKLTALTADLYYHRAVAEAWEARCRVAVSSMKFCIEVDGMPSTSWTQLDDALCAIGQLPPLP